ncbi:hypothetical protein BG842_07085 [Haladaptatus sp. W1]|nr:hypothetical protein BG842_07085 [Haladaptatus sp. W1]
MEGTEFEANTHTEPLFECWKDAITVTRIPANGRIEVSGQIESGGRSCMETVLETVGMDEESDTLVLIVADEQKQGARGCTMEEALVGYDATVRMKGDTPTRIRIRHWSELGTDGGHYQLDETLVFDGGPNRETKSVSC